MSLGFLRAYSGQRVAAYAPQPPLPTRPSDDEDLDAEEVKRGLGYEIDMELWEPQEVIVPPGWHPKDWLERPVRFVDGKDVGETVAWLKAPGGYPVPVRLSEIGGVAVRLVDGVCQREFEVVERVVSMVVNPFPWDQVESFAAALQQHGFRLLPAEPPGGAPSYDFEEMRKAAQNRSNDEMGVLEEAALAQDPLVPTVIDGRLEPRQGGLDQVHSPAVGVVKTHLKPYLHALGMQVLYDLKLGERTPLFALPKQKLPVVSWYLRLSPAGNSMPNWGLIRVEVPLRWFERLATDRQKQYVSFLSRMLCDYRTRDGHYARAPVSLHPIVRAEALLGALFTPRNVLTNRFYHLTNL